MKVYTSVHSIHVNYWLIDTFTCGSLSFIFLPIPATVPPVPAPMTTISRSPSNSIIIIIHISSEVTYNTHHVQYIQYPLTSQNRKHLIDRCVWYDINYLAIYILIYQQVPAVICTSALFNDFFCCTIVMSQWVPTVTILKLIKKNSAEKLIMNQIIFAAIETNAGLHTHVANIILLKH